jgi:hypothetical protein
MHFKYKNTNKIILYILLFTAKCSFAFEGYEHRNVGDRSLEIAIEYTLSKHPNNQLLKESSTTIYSLKKNNSHQNKSYGEIVELIDFIIAPNKIFVHSGDNGLYPNSYLELNPDIFGKYPQIKSGDDSYLRASHNNEAHFQGELLFNIHDWHKKALSIAKNEKNIFAALVTNAISDHYLHDFFAPGHIVTPRDNFHDTFALGMHDKNNQIGATFFIENWHELSNILNFIKMNNVWFSKQSVKELELNHTKITLHGDDLLKSNEVQEIFMTLVEVKSISEVFDFYLDQTNKTSFEKYTWHTSEYDPENNVLLRTPIAEIRYGRYEFAEIKKINGKVNATNLQVIAKTRTYSPVAGFSASYESLLIDQGQNRINLTAEIVPFGIPGSPDFLRRSSDKKPSITTNWGPAIGFTYLHANNYSAYGPALRSIWAFPRIDSQFSIYGRYLNYESSFNEISKFSFGARADIGFSLFTAFFMAGKDYGYDSNFDLKSGFLFGAGITASFPFSRVPGLNYFDSLLSGDLSE